MVSGGRHDLYNARFLEVPMSEDSDDRPADVALMARAAVAAGDASAAVLAYRRLVRAEPDAAVWRLRLADALDASEDADGAARVRSEMASGALAGGSPLAGLSAGVAGASSELVAAFAPYLAGSDRLGRTAPPRPPAPPGGRSVPADDPEAPLPPWAAAVGPLHPVPLLSALDAEAFEAVLDHLTRRSLNPGETLVCEGEVAGSVYYMVGGTLSVSKHDDFRGEQALGRITAGSVVGEMALVLNRPRTATVSAIDDVETLRLEIETLRALAATNPSVDRALRRYTQQRLLSMLIDTSPLFRGLQPGSRAALLTRFQSHRVAAGETVITQGEERPALWLVMNGEVDVLRSDAGGPAKVARLGAGQVFGEMSFVTGEPASASVVASSETALMALASEDLAAVCSEHPEVESRLRALTDERVQENRFIFEDDEFFEDAD